MRQPATVYNDVGKAQILGLTRRGEAGRPGAQDRDVE
jgi:hypothetical protein